MDLYDYTAKDANGKDVQLSDYRGKVLLIVNTATGCGFTPQYAGLQKLYLDYKDQGFEILDFPCNQFGNQAPGTQEEIGNFCSVNYGITFKQFEKIDVNGSQAHPLFMWLKKEKSGMFCKAVKWNFTKFLVDRNGKVQYRFAPIDKPEKIGEKIRTLL